MLYCTKLAKAQSASERAQIEEDMRMNPELAPVLAILKGEDDGGV